MPGILSLQDEESNYSADDDMLDWTITPTTEVLKDGFARCFIATPQPSCGSLRSHPLYLVREMEIVPGKLRADAAAEKRPCLEIRVKEEDFRKCGSDLQLLSKHALPKMTPKTGPSNTPSRHKSFKLKRCSSIGIARLPDPSKSNFKEVDSRNGSAHRQQQLSNSTSDSRLAQLAKGNGASHASLGADGRPCSAPPPVGFKKPRPPWKAAGLAKAPSVEVYSQALNARVSKKAANLTGLAPSASLPTLLGGKLERS
mmetsp:Transcript_145261/g.253521  ORF Transcript_145261/g.253521 Transcript_145261/m.253521 type:complete len:256 (+) Transcript_145261:77-844(+)